MVKTDGFPIVRFIKEPWVGLKQLEEFLEISPEISEENFFFNATKVKCLSIAANYKKVTSLISQGFYCGLQQMTVPTQSPHVWTCTRWLIMICCTRWLTIIIVAVTIGDVTKLVGQFGYKLISAHCTF